MSSQPRRSFSSRKSPSLNVGLGGENLTYFIGTGYLAGSITGVGKGIVEGVKVSEPCDAVKLRVNRILNVLAHT
ncbi:hypothetical protein U1Q18_037085 [Sarracenia purpurea var. burkii]